jgi:hypothetical protein
MANNSKGKVIQMLSPENYIRQKARNLPVMECMINSNWEDEKIANIVIARQHTNGKITLGIYLVDLLCLGVKETGFAFNISPLEYREKIEQFTDGDQFDRISYELAHNIIYAGVEFAEDYGFKPHKDFTSTTCFILDDDTDDIPLMDIECGHNGLPAYMPGPEDNTVRMKQVIAQLEREAGSGNYYLFDAEGNLIGDDDEDDFEDEFSDMTFEEKRDEFMRSYQEIDWAEKEVNEHFFELIQSLIDDMIDEEEHDRYYEELFVDFLEIEIDDSEIPDEMLGAPTGTTPFSDEIKKQFIEIFKYINNPKQFKKQLDLFRKNKEVEETVEYLELFSFDKEDSNKYEAKLKAAVLKYPNYSMIQILWAKYLIKDDKIDQLPKYPFKIEDFFKGRNTIHPWEQYFYIDMCTYLAIAEKNFIKLEALKTVLTDLDIEQYDAALLYSLILIVQTEVLAASFKSTNSGYKLSIS